MSDLEKLLQFFEDNKVHVQITLDVGLKPTVHAFCEGEGIVNLRKTSGRTLVEALQNMKVKIFGYHNGGRKDD